MIGLRYLRRLMRRGGCLGWFAVVCVLCAGFAFAQETPLRTLIPTGPYRIAGTVVSAKGGSPLARSRVTITDSKKRQNVLSVVSGDDGRFEFHVPAGKYSLQGAKRGFIASSYNQHEQFWTAIVTGGDVDTENLILRLSPDAILSGKVLDEFGEPVRQAQITVYRENHFQGVSRVFRFRNASTDDQGRYEVTPLDEGTYFVSAKAAPWYAIHPTTGGEGAGSAPQVDPSLDVVYPITYYGDATEAEDATPIPVRGGDRLEADIHLNPLPSLHIILHAGQDGGVRVPVLTKPAFDGVEQVDTGTLQSGAAGVSELTGIAAGRYTVRMVDSNGQLQEPAEMSLSGGELDAPSARPLGKIKATVQMEGGGGLPAHLQIVLRNGKGRANSAQVDSKGEATFSDVIPGKYDVMAASPSETQSYAVGRITSEAGTSSGHSMTVAAGASLTVSLVLVGSAVTIEGFAKRDGKASPGAMVVLVPTDPEANLDRFRRDQSDLDGSFSLQNVIPGSYSVVAIENGWDLDWSKAAVLSRYLKHGQTVEVGGRAQTPMRLAAAVDVQAK